MKQTVITALLLMVSVVGISAAASSEDGRPEYQKEYEAYMRDLAVIAETGKAPENPGLDADLAKMDSEEKIRLTAQKDEEVYSEKISAVYVQPMLFAQLQDNSRAQIVNSVEIVRIPEEFRQQYGSVYDEANQVISAQDLSLAQASNQRKMIVDESTAKVASHNNPFRFLKEVPLSLPAGEYGTRELPLNPMVDAYFNQFGRPYAAGEPQTVPTEEVKPVNKKSGKSVIDTLSLRNSMFVN